MAGTRTRLDIDLRRSQLVEIGMELFAKRPYDEVSVEEIAAAAGQTACRQKLCRIPWAA